MARFKYDRDTITGNQITEYLIDQYGYNQQIAVTIPDMDKQVSYDKSLISLKCNRCGASFSLTPKMTLESIDMKGYICSNCGNLSNTELRERKQLELRELSAKRAEERGVDLDKLEQEKAEAEAEKEDLKYSEYEIDTMNDEIDESDIQEELSREGLDPTVEENIETSESENTKDDDMSEYMYDEDEDNNLTLEDAISNASDIVPDDDDDNFEEDVEDDSEDYDFEEDIEDYSTEEEDIEDDVETVIEDVETEKESQSAEELIAEPKSVIEESKNLETTSNETEEVKEEINPVTTFLVGNKRMTVEEIQSTFEESITRVKKFVGFVPYQRRVSPEGNSVKVTCGICGKDFLVDNPMDLIDKSIILTKDYCIQRGIGYKAPFGKDAKLYYCPHCNSSIVRNNYNEYLRGLCVDTCDKKKLKIVDIEAYWFAGFNERITVEANGVHQVIFIRDLFDKYAKVSDATELPEFKPLGDETKSTTDERTKETESKTKFSFESNTTKSNFTIKKQSPFNGTAVDSNSKLDKEREEQFSSVKENNVFHINQKIKDEYSNVAKIDSKINPFARNKSLESSFQKSPFASFINDLSDETGLECTLILNDRTFEIPIIDFENGYRIICVDIDDNSMTKVPYNIITNCVKFKYRPTTETYREIDGSIHERDAKYADNIRNFKCIILYSDSVLKRRDATLDALIKFINPTILPYKGKMINLSESGIKTYYTDYKPYLKEFDSQYSTFPAGKPKNGQLGIVATWDDSGNYGHKTGFKDIMNFQSMMQGNNRASLTQLNSDYSQYLVASIKYIERLNKDTGKVVYTITDYVEVGSSILQDGLSLCLRGLLKEYQKKYPQIATVSPHIIMEIDPNAIPSPSLKSYINRKILCEVDDVYKSLVDGRPYMKRGKESHLKYTYVRKSEYRSQMKDSDWCRQDMRMFGAGTLALTMADELKTAGVSSAITDERTRLAFISNMGFTKNNQFEIKEYFVDQGVIQNYMMDSETALLQKLPNPEDSLVKSGLVNTSADGANINNIMTNPVLMNKYFNIMNNSNPEARAYFVNNVLYNGQAPMGMNPMGMQMPGMGMPMMGGMNPMMGGMPGMNPMGMGMQQPMGMPGMGMNPMMGMSFDTMKPL